MTKKQLIVMCLLAVLVSGCSDAENQVEATGGTDPSSNQLHLVLDVYKSPTCGCCAVWVDHLNAEGIGTRTHDTNEMQGIKESHGIGSGYQSCHTAVHKDGYVFEGHIPARVIEEFLKNPPEGTKGLSVPGMPLGSPGMEVGDRFQPYDIYQLNVEGAPTVYLSIDTYQDQF